MRFFHRGLESVGIQSGGIFRKIYWGLFILFIFRAVLKILKVEIVMIWRIFRWDCELDDSVSRRIRWIKGIFKKRGFIIFVSIEILEGFLVRLSMGSF